MAVLPQRAKYCLRKCEELAQQLQLQLKLSVEQDQALQKLLGRSNPCQSSPAIGGENLSDCMMAFSLPEQHLVVCASSFVIFHSVMVPHYIIHPRLMYSTISVTQIRIRRPEQLLTSFGRCRCRRLAKHRSTKRRCPGAP